MLITIENDYNQKNILEIECDECKKIFFRNKRDFRNRKEKRVLTFSEMLCRNHFCSHECVNQYHYKQSIMLHTFICSHCGIQFQRKLLQSKCKNKTKIYCSNKCALTENRSHQQQGKCKDCGKIISTASVRCVECREKLKSISKNSKDTSKYVKSFYKRSKEKAVKYLGSKCFLCGYNRYLGALQFHHIDPSTKSFNISGRTICWEKLQKELDKCVLLCANCHAEVESGLVSLLLKNNILVDPAGLEPATLALH